MNTMVILGTVLGLAALSGINLYATVAITGLAVRLAWVVLPVELGGIEVLASWWVIGIATGMYVVEFVADKWPWLDNIWDTVHTFIRPPAAALVALAATSETANPVIQVVAVLLAGGVALGTHSAKATTRLIVNTASPHEPVSNIALSIGEDALVAASVMFVMTHPIITLGILCALAILAIWLGPKLARAVACEVRGLAHTARYLWRHREAIAWGPPSKRFLGDLTFSSILVSLPCASGKLRRIPRNHYGWLVLTDRKEIAFLTRRWFRPARAVWTSVEVERLEYQAAWYQHNLVLHTTTGKAVFKLFRNNPQWLQEKVNEICNTLGIDARKPVKAEGPAADTRSSASSGKTGEKAQVDRVEDRT